ncbi:hypothetical protein ES707_11576 [subsurface metagenome]
MQPNNVFVVEDVIVLGVLPVINTRPPYPCELQFACQFEVDIARKNGKLTNAVIRSKLGRKCRASNPRQSTFCMK